MFGRSKPVVLESYGSRRARKRLPRWLVLLLSGIAVGVAGVLVAQERYLPPRLTASESSALREKLESAEAERSSLAQQLGTATQELGTAQADRTRLSDELAASRAQVERLNEDLTLVVGALPADPRSGSVEVRAGRFSAQSGQLNYNLVLTRDRAGARPLSGVMQVVVAGMPARGPETSVTLKPVQLALGSHQILRGSLPLPEGFQPREATVRVLDGPAGRPLGMRVILVR